MPNYVVETSEGKAVFTAETPRPRVLLFHGFKRSAQQLLPWRDRIPDLGFVHLPGHSGAPQFTEVSFASWIKGFRQMLAVFPEPPLILAESLGAVVAMALPARALIAIEPPLSTDQLWPLHRTIAAVRARGGEVDPALVSLFEKPFHWALESIAVPTLVLAGRVPLMPPREVWPEPSLLDDKDFAAFQNHPLVEAHRIEGGHALLTTHPEEVMAAATPFMTRHGYLKAPPAG